jgi:hypothetical protein
MRPRVGHDFASRPESAPSQRTVTGPPTAAPLRPGHFPTGGRNDERRKASGSGDQHTAFVSAVQEVGALETTRETEAAALMKWDEQSTRQLEEADPHERAWQPERRRENLQLELELDVDRTPAGRPVSDVVQIAVSVDTPDVAAPDPSCGFERVFGPDWRTRYPAIAGGVDEARRQRTSPTAPADDPRRSGPPPGEQGSAFETRNSGDRWLANPRPEGASGRRKPVASRRRVRNPGGASVDPRLPKLSGHAK